MHTDEFCKTLDALDRADAIKAIHAAFLQLSAMGVQVEVNGTTYDNEPAISRLKACMVSAGHIGFTS